MLKDSILQCTSHKSDNRIGHLGCGVGAHALQPKLTTLVWDIRVGGSGIILLMIYLKDPKVRELWYIPYYG